jgi:hypothetical protein
MIQQMPTHSLTHSPERPFAILILFEWRRERERARRGQCEMRALPNKLKLG